MEYLQFAQQNGNPSVYSNKYTMQNTPILTKFKPCDQSLTPYAENAYLQERAGQQMLINNNAQKNQILGMSNQYVGSMQQYQPIFTVSNGYQLLPVQSSQQPKQSKENAKLSNFLFILLIVFIAINVFTYMKLQKMEYQLKYSKQQGDIVLK